MAGKISGAMERALEAVDASFDASGAMGRTITEIAAEAGVDVSALRRAMRRLGYDARKPTPGTVVRAAAARAGV